MESLKTWNECRQIQLINKGLIEVEGMKFHSIEGGFGEHKKSMLVKDIASIHKQPLGEVNRRINNNRARFKNNIDIIDLKVGGLKPLSLEMGYTNQAYANANNIYLLSERGYAKLLKILEDDFAWEQYDKLVDGYFNMRAGNKEGPSCVEDVLIQSLQEMKQVREQLNHVNHNALAAKAKAEQTKEEVNVKFDELPLFQTDLKMLKKLVNRKVVPLLGGKNTTAYIQVSKRVFSDIYRQVHREFGVTGCEEIKRKDFNLVKKMIEEYKLPLVLEDEIDHLNNQFVI